MDCNCTDKQDDRQFREAVALLKYMIDHNKHHTDELYDVANRLDGDAKELVHAAVIEYEKGNGKLEQALNLLGKDAECVNTGECHHHHHDEDHHHDEEGE